MRGEEMTGEQLSEESEVLSDLASDLDSIGFEFCEHEVSGEHHRKVVETLSRLEDQLVHLRKMVGGRQESRARGQQDVFRDQRMGAAKEMVANLGGKG